MIERRNVWMVVAIAAVLALPTAAATPVALTLGTATDAPDPTPLLTLEEAIRSAMDGNRMLRVADAGLLASEASMKEAHAPRLPTVGIDWSFSRTTNPTLVFSNKLGQENFTAADFDPASLNNPDPLNNFNATLAVSQAVYAGGKIKNAKLAARHGHDANLAGRERTRQEVVAAVIEAYSGVVLAEARRAVAREALKTSEENVRLVTDQHRAGMVVESDVLQARVRQSEVEEMAIRAQNGVGVARAGLNMALGRDLDTRFRVDPRGLQAESIVEEPLDLLVDEAVRQRPDLARAESQARAAERTVKMNRSGWIPEVGVQGLAEKNSEQFLSVDGSNWSVFAGVRWTAFDGNATKAQVRRARHEAVQVREMQAMMRDAVGLEVRTRYAELDASRKGHERAVMAEDLAEESLRIVRDRYQEGIANFVELLAAENALTGARTRQVETLRQVMVAEAQLRLAVGRL